MSAREPLSIYVPIHFKDHAGQAEHNGQVYHFRTSEAAAKFLARVGKRSTGITHARDCHKPAQRVEVPELIRRSRVKAAMQVITEPPPDGNRPTPALRIVRAAEKQQEQEQAA